MAGRLSRPQASGSGQRPYDDVKADSDDNAGKGTSKRVLMTGEMTCQSNAEQAAERATKDKESRETPID